MVCRRG
ncbi:Protein of unknown function [Gryllus bimaculatus]|nr:Protein of unknown function [Gryllus bimaculatus]